MKISEICSNLYLKLESVPSLKFEKIAFCCFCFLVILISFFHEPWFDESQAWGISKDSLYNILFVIPHHEGHLPLWHLIIKFFSIFNIDFELCLKIPNTIFIILGTWFLIFKSPFPRTVRLFLPFTYFIFYQYGIICRPYSMMYLAIVLCAVFFDSKNTNSFRYVSLLGFLSCTSGHGLAIASGITIAWGLELLDFKNLKQSFKNLLKSKQFFAMLLLFVFCLLITICIFPSEKCTVLPLVSFLPIWQKILVCTFVAPSDALIFDVIPEHHIFSDFFNNFYGLYFIIAVCFGLFVTLFLLRIFRKTKTLAYYIIPYFLLVCLFYRYYFTHHVGLLFFLIIFCLWISYEKLITSLTKKEIIILKILTILTIFVQLSWGLLSGIEDIFLTYENSRSIASYINKFELYKYKIFAGNLKSHYYIDDSGNVIIGNYAIEQIDRSDDKKELYTRLPLNIHDMYIPVLTIPYFGRNIYYNFNSDAPEKYYVTHTKRSNSETNAIIQNWKKHGLPDVIVGETNFYEFWNEVKLTKDYIRIKDFCSFNIWKGFIYDENHEYIYMHKDLFKKLNFKEHIIKESNIKKNNNR